MEEREKLVGRMWDMYTRISDEVRLPQFWQEAFEAAYEELAGDDTQVRDAAVAEIARMSAHKLELEQTVNENEVCPISSGSSQLPPNSFWFLNFARLPFFHHVISSHFDISIVLKPRHANLSHFRSIV
jgi:hypothetical protein